jgi:diguanylate cyclase (GGDEF)-like protein
MSLAQYGLADLEVLKQGQMCVIPDITAVSDRAFTLEVLRRQGMQSYVRIPLIVEGALVGALNLWSDVIAYFTPERLHIARTIADQLAIALQQALLRDRISRLNRIHAVLSGINSLIVRAGDRSELYCAACRIAITEGKFSMVWLGTVDHQEMRVKPVAWDGRVGDFFEALPHDTEQIKQDQLHPFAQVVTHKKVVISNDIQNDPRSMTKEKCLARGINSVALLPLTVQGEVIGVLGLYAEELGFFDNEEMKLLIELADNLSFAVDHLEKGEKIDYLAYHDELTGLANRSLFLERVGQYTNRLGSDQHKLAVAITDVERFRTIHDTLGRQAGDQLLKQIGERLAHCSGEPKWILVPDVETEEEVARSIEQWMQACFGTPFMIAGTELRVSVKFGVGISAADGSDAETLLQNADAALKKAKATGEKYLFYTQQMNERTAGQLTLENQLRQALEKEEFVLYYQPKISLETRRIESVEALIRWNSPELGLVPPMRFIPLMEETGMILEVGAWALRKATHDHCRWLQQGLAAPRIAVNVSAIQLHKRDFVRTVQLALEHGATPPGIDLEITESVVMGDIQDNIDKLTALREMGLSISIDDFGTGYSSLAYLTKLPVQMLKIDRSFVVKMLDEPDTMTLVSTIISLAHSLRLKVVAEGVETEQQAQALRALRCDQMQGYLFSKPLPADELVMLLEK